MKSRKITLGVLMMLSIFAVLFSASHIFENATPIQIASNTETVSLEAQTIAVAEKSKYFYLNKDAGEGPKVSAAAYLIGDLNTGEVILAKNQEEKFPIASVSKLM